MSSSSSNSFGPSFPHNIISDDMHLGKTVQTIATILINPPPLAAHAKSTLVVVTANLISKVETFVLIPGSVQC